MKSIQDRARELEEEVCELLTSYRCGQSIEEHAHSWTERVAKIESALRAHLDEIQAQVEGLRTTYLWGQFAIVPKEDVLALLATLRQ